MKETLPKSIKIKYVSENMPRIAKKDAGDWLDLRCDEHMVLEAGKQYLIPLGIAMELPPSYEAYVLPRGSSFKNWGVLQTNSTGIVDNAYCGNEDFWFWPVFATRDAIIEKYERVCQFRIQLKMPNIMFEEVETLTGKNRGGHGSSGTK